MRRYRRGLQVGLLIVIAAFIASLFVFGQRGFGDGAGRDAVATVNGESIPLARYQQRYQAFMEAYARIYRDRFSPELAERLGLPQQVVNELIQEALIVQRARAEGLLVTDEELNAQIQAVPAFQENGRFALKRYQEYVRRRGLAAAAFENEMRRELTRMKVEQAVRGGVKVTRRKSSTRSSCGARKPARPGRWSSSGRSSPRRRRATTSSGSTWARIKTSFGSPSDAGSSP